jgi:beta-lactam-binding protein with PASTA domain/predicted Ser/Thr protein kinase
VTNNGERTVLNDRYEIQQRIGRGGMADVLLARDLLLDRPVAIKVLFAEFATDPNFVERFRREAQSAAALNHPNIVSVYDWGKYGGTYFIAMEYVEGRTLADIVRSNGRVSPVQAAEIASEVSAALSFAHRNGVVHRDIKPANILIGTSGQVKVADFGIARAMNSAADSNLTQVGLVMGTATYFSPEQAQGAQPDPRSDLYSLGIVMYEMVGGRPPFAGDNPVSIAYKQVHENPQPLNQLAPDVPRPFEAIVAKLLAKNPATRYADGDALRDDLRRFRNGEPVKALAGAATPPGPSVRPGVSGATTVARTVTPPRPSTGAVGAVGVGAAASSTAMMPRTAGVPLATGANPRTTINSRSQYPTGANEAVYYDPPQRRGWWGIAAFIAVVALAIGGVVLFKALNNGKDKATSFGLVDVTNLPLLEATQKVLDAGLKPTAVQKAYPDAPEGVVYDTDPKPGVIVRQGQEIKLYYNPQSEMLPVPDVTLHALADAKDILTGLGFVAGAVKEVEDPTVPIGQVISQDPPAGTPEKQGATVNLTVSQGKGKVTIVKVVNTPVDTAKSLLETQYGLVVVTADENNDTVPAGSVIRTDPAADTVVDKGSTITLFVSTGPKQVAVPPLTGLTETAARNLLSERGLIADPVTYTDVPFGSVNDKRVLSQNIPLNTPVNSSSSVGIVVGRAVPQTTTAPTTPPTTPPTAAPTTTPATTPPTTTPPTAAPATTTTSAATTTTSGP